MTLTRPDLRAHEKMIYERRGRTTTAVGRRDEDDDDNDDDDPLALEHLPEMGDARGDLWDTLPPVKESGLRKIWRKVAGKGA